ncbi:MAG: hypothetical protein DIZ80_13695 [endosymbiont of Galathealinum brachiosum]|uniref:Outer membrane protein beta-barrel domain-containing protein n=1 Tax=endosymbiont of Galathealinum brachiosum TaxID=2200906 RepID=A0A370D8C3_9GAMM|nr:MAG: hypothetical protein DIZ80_13695 [endosymbiont of Galathealinum brachiosum]
MKNICAIFFILLLSTKANAEGFFDNTIFGIAFINQNVDIEVTGTNAGSFSDSGSGLGLYLDKYYKKKYRFNSTLSYVTYDTFDITELIFSADYLVPVSPQISFFGGAALGGALQTFSDSSASDGALGAVYGVQLGGIVFINNNLMLEAGYRLRPTSIETEITGSTDIVTIDDLSETYISLLLMF